MLVTPSPIPCPAKGGVEQDQDLEGLQDFYSEGELKVREGEEDETTLLALIEVRDFQGATSRLLVIVAQLQGAVKSYIYVNKPAKIEADTFKTI